MNILSDRRILDVLAQGARLNILVAEQIRDVNEAHLLVHGLMARAMNEVCSPATEQDLELALARWFADHAILRNVRPWPAP